MVDKNQKMHLSFIAKSAKDTIYALTQKRKEKEKNKRLYALTQILRL